MISLDATAPETVTSCVPPCRALKKCTLVEFRPFSLDEDIDTKCLCALYVMRQRDGVRKMSYKDQEVFVSHVPLYRVF